MSLFKIRDWWTVKSGEGIAGTEHFSSNSFCVGNIDNSSDCADKIVLGSLNGILRIYNPHKSGVPNRPESSVDYRPSDLILEVQLKEPILQLCFGAFVSGNSPRGNQLAILHPRRLSVCTLTGAKGAVDHGYQFQLAPLYEHVLERSAYNMCFGPFADSKAKDYIAVQSVDCTLSIFEHEHPLFSRFLPNSLLPGPLKYWPVSNSFLTVSSSWMLESYRFETLAVATEAKTKEESQSIKTSKRITPDWVVNIGESALQIETTLLAAGAPTSRALILGERNLFCVNDVGELIFSLKLDYNPICLFVTKTSRDSVNFIVANHFNSLMFYENELLRWSAHASFTPTSIAVGHIKALRGAVILLSSSGQLSIGYLGTDPTLFSVAPPAAGRDVKWDAYEREMKMLDDKIREKSKPLGASLSKSSAAEEEVFMKVNISRENLTLSARSKELKIQGQVVLSLRRGEAEDVRLHILSQSPISVDPITTKIGRLDQASGATVKFTLSISRTVLASSLSIKFAASYLYKASPRLVLSTIELPINTISKPVYNDGNKLINDPNAMCKITIDSNMAPVPVGEIFQEFANVSSPESVTAELAGNSVTILAAKNSNRYRVQGPSLSSCSLFLTELAMRLIQRRGQSLTFTDAFPLDEMQSIIAEHLQARTDLSAAEKRLASASSQIIAVEKRLLARVRDKTPSKIDDMHLLLSSCQHEINLAIDHVDEAKMAEASAGASLAAAVRALCLLIKLWRDLGDDEYAVLLSVMQPDNVSSDGRGGMQHGWEELVDSALVYLLRSVLSARSENTRDAVFNPSPLAQPSDRGEGLLKHLKMMLDRMSKGARLVNVEAGCSSSSSSGQSVKLATKFPMENLLDESSASSELAVKTAGEQQLPKQPKPKKTKFKKSSAAAPENLETTGGLENSSLPPMAGSMSFAANGLLNDTSLPDLNALPSLGRQKPSRHIPKHIADAVPDLDDM